MEVDALPQSYGYSSAIGYSSAETVSESSSEPVREAEPAPAQEELGNLVDVTT